MTEQLKRTIQTPGAIMMGLGSIVGTGLFVSIAIATQIAGNGVLIAIFIAAVLAMLNGLSSAQLAAAHPVSGGTYEYGYKYLGSYFGFSAGWMFLIAKTASAATAVLGSISYIAYLLGLSLTSWQIVIWGLALLFLMIILVSGQISRTNRANMIIVSFTLIGLLFLIGAGFWQNGLPAEPVKLAFSNFDPSAVLYASALMFVAYTGYGRIATLGEEVKEPLKTIPKAIILTMIFIVLLYAAVMLTALNTMGADAFGNTLDGAAAPLTSVAELIAVPGVGLVVSIAAITAMLGVLLNLLLGISRVILAMARRRDLPHRLSAIRASNSSPVAAVAVTGAIIAFFVLTGDVIFTWSFSAFTVLIYYAITNLSAFMLPDENRLYPRVIPVAGFSGCLFLAFWIEPKIWILGLALLVVGLLWHTVANKLKIVSH